MRNGVSVAFASPLIGPGQRVPGGRHDRLAEADAAVVAGGPGALKDGETSVLQGWRMAAAPPGMGTGARWPARRKSHRVLATYLRAPVRHRQALSLHYPSARSSPFSACLKSKFTPFNTNEITSRLSTITQEINDRIVVGLIMLKFMFPDPGASAAAHY
jgi:hypothetical protein